MFKTGYVCIFYHSFHFVYRLESCNKSVLFAMYAKPKALLPINLNKKNLPAHTNFPKGIRILLRIDSLFTDPLFSVTKSVRGGGRRK